MIVLKQKIKTIPSLPPSPKDKEKKSNIIKGSIFFIVFIAICYFIYIKLTPYIYAVNINKIIGKKINITTCNTKDYIIISKDKSYSMTLTNNDCEQINYEGDLYIKNRQVIFTYFIEKDTNKAEKEKVKEKLFGTIDENYNIIINNNLFEKEENDGESDTTNTK